MGANVRRALFLLTALSAVCSGLCFTAGAASIGSCSFSQADLVANDRLSYDDFDQKGVLSSTWRALDNRQCYKASVTVMQDYLISGPIGTSTQRQDLLFHLGQSLGMAGHNSEAALVIAGARRGGIEPDGFDFGTYVVGTWAYFVHDRSKLQVTRDKLRVESGYGNQLNTRALTGLISCFNKPYQEAYSKKCRN